jgi:hypothetical protein
MLFLFACAPSVPDVGDVSTDPPTVALSGPAAIDPLHGAQTWAADTNGTLATFEILDASGALVRTLTDGTWDGRTEDGLLAPIGSYTVHAAIEEGDEDELSVALVRVGVLSGTFGGPRVPLMWHDGEYWSDDGEATSFSVSTIDAAEAVVPIPAVWDDLYEPPDSDVDVNLPAAYVYSAKPTLSVVVAGDLAGADLSAAIDGWTLTSGDVTAGGTVTFTRDTALAAGPGVVEAPLTLSWLSGESVVGTQSIPVRLYALLAEPAFEREGLPYQPWVAVVDPALRAIQGVDPTEAAVTSGLVEHIYRDLGLSYDTRWGASAYTLYDGNGFDNAHFDLTSFLERGRGSVVNCTDCAAILEAFANMVGATLEYTIITPGFDLNFIQAIGSDHFSHCPFDGGGCGFSYHAVTTPDDGGLIYDATLALDGDADPSSTPSEELLVQAIDGEEYLDRLVQSGRTGYRYTQKETLQ